MTVVAERPCRMTARPSAIPTVKLTFTLLSNTVKFTFTSVKITFTLVKFTFASGNTTQLFCKKLNQTP